MKRAIIILVSWSLCFYPNNLSSQRRETRRSGWYDTTTRAIDNISSSIVGTSNFNPNMPSPQMATPAQNLQDKILSQEQLPLPFRGCLVAKALPIAPPQKCEAEIFPGPQSQQHAQHYGINKAGADQNIGFLESMLDQAQNETATTAPSGIKCLEDRVILEETKFQNLLNHLTTQADLIKRKNEIFKRQRKNAERQMEDIHALLNGTVLGKEEDNNKKERSLSGIINSRQCEGLLSKGVMDNATREGGLLKLRSDITTKNDKALEYRNQEKQLEDEVKKQISEISGNIGTYGIDAWLQVYNQENTSSVGEQKLGGLQAIKKNEIQQFNLARARLQRELKSAGLNDLPGNMGRNFSGEFGRYRANYRDTAEKRHIENCVFDNPSSGGIGNIRTLISKLYQPGVRGQGTVNSFKSELQGILNSRGYVEEKLDRVQSLVEKYGENTVVVDFMRDGRRTSSNITGLLRHSIAYCRQQYERDIKTDTGISSKQQHNRVGNLLEEYQDLASDFSNKMTSSLREKILRCDGQTVTTESCRQGDHFSSESDSFCFTKAKKCSLDISSCHTTLDNLVKQKTNDLNIMADLDNKKRKAFIDHQNAVLTDLKLQMGTYAEQINAIVPGANFAFPEDMFIKTPELSRSRLGVLLLGGNKVESLFEELPKKINDLKTNLSAQNEKMQLQLEKRIQSTRESLQNSLAEWKQVTDSCGQKLQSFQAKMVENQMQQEQQEMQQAENFESFCRKYSDLQGRSLGAGCGDLEDLYSDSMNIARHLIPVMDGDIKEYNNLCSELQNESEFASENEDRNAGGLLRSCFDNPIGTVEHHSTEDNRGIVDRLTKYTKERAKERINALFPIDLEKITAIAKEYKTKCSNSALPETHQAFCNNFNTNILPVLNDEDISQDDYNNIKQHLRTIPRTPALARPTVSGDIPLLTEQEEELRDTANDKLGIVFGSEKNFCNYIATTAVVNIISHCRNNSHARNCFHNKLEEYEDRGTPETKNIQRDLDRSSRGTLFGETSLSDTACNAFYDGERSAEGYNYNDGEDSDSVDDFFRSQQTR